MPARQPDGPPPPPVVQRLRVQYAKRGRLRFTSHRDIARALERAIRRAGLPIAFSAGFTAHPKVSYLGAAATGAASEAEFVEIGLAERREPSAVCAALDAALPPGLDVLRVVEVLPGTPALADRVEASRWRVELPGTPPELVRTAVTRFLAEPEVRVIRRTRDGQRELDARAAVVSCSVAGDGHAILDLVARHTTPAVRPEDVVAGLASVAPFGQAVPPVVTRLAQGLLGGDGRLGDPLEPCG
ncbi:MAG: TIGR03936 family radical SAM-associated protein [Mycobacteriales bacterium]